MPSKYFSGVDLDDKGNIKLPRAAPYSPYPAFNAAPTNTVAYRSNELHTMPDEFFLDLSKRVAMEQVRRTQNYQRLPAVLEHKEKLRKAKTNEQITAFQNFLLGCAHAMACRAALRWGNGHRPYSPDGLGSGKSAMSGEVWNVFDVAKLGDKMLGYGSKAHGGVVDGNRIYVVNSNPINWPHSGINTETAMKVWLRPSANQAYPGGSSFCSYSK